MCRETDHIIFAPSTCNAEMASQRDLQTSKLLMKLLVSAISKRINVVLIEIYFACLVDKFIDY